MTIEIGTRVIAWNPGTDRKAKGFLTGYDGDYFRVEWTRVNAWGIETYVGTFKFAEVA